MTDSERIKELFIHYCIAPEPATAGRLRRRMYREAQRTLKAGREPGELDSRFRARVAAKLKWYTMKIRQNLFDPVQYQDWRPLPENWIQLAIAMANHHGEAGFEFNPPRADLRLENAFVQDNLIEGLRRRGARSDAEAARGAAKFIREQRKPGGLYGSTIKEIRAESLMSAYSARKSKPGRLPPSLEVLLESDSYMRELMRTALQITKWPETRFYSSDSLDDCMARMSEEHAQGPLIR